MATIAEDKKQIDRLLKKCEIKDANGMNSDKELMEALELMAAHPAPQEEVDAYVDGYTKLALTVLNEAGEVLSDIPMGRARQFMNLVDREFIAFKDMFKKYKNQKCTGIDISESFKRFHAVAEYLSDILTELGDKETTFIPELDEIEELNKPVIAYHKSTDILVYFEALENTLHYDEYVIQFVHNALETNNKGLMNATSVILSIENLYMHGIIDFFEKMSKAKTPGC